MRNIGLVYDACYLEHILEPNHPESPQRLKCLIDRLQQSSLNQQLTWIKPQADPVPPIQYLHSAAHIEKVHQEAYDYRICEQAVAGVLTAVDQTLSGTIDHAFCAVRPPGHHAENNGEFGFCFYANVAAGARYAQQQWGLERILIVDWDFHHGNGTETMFYDDPGVLFFSTHNPHAFPGTGLTWRLGSGAGLGYTINAPLESGATDQDILNAFERKLLAQAQRFKPQLILISAGFDSRKEDYLGDFRISDEGFQKLTRLLLSLATDTHCPIVSVLEGGYNPHGVALAAETHIRSLADD